MNQVKLNNLIKEKRVALPLYLLRMYKDLNLNIDEFVLLCYLYDKNESVFNPTLISNDLGLDLMKVMEIISNLEDKGIMHVKTLKDEKGIMEEVIDLDPLFNKITMKIIDELNKEDVSDINIHNIVELEFNRKLTPLEHDVIDEWERNNYNKELIREAVKEASIYGVSNLRYIDAILNEWSKKGYKVPSDVKKNKDTTSKEQVEIFDCDWLNEDEDEEI